MTENRQAPSKKQPIRVFISSPADVAHERALALEVLERLSLDPLLKDRVVIDIDTWERPGTVFFKVVVAKIMQLFLVYPVFAYQDSR